MASLSLVKTKGLQRDEWLQWRKKGIGGSDASAVAGLNPWKSPIAVYFDKIGEVEPEEPGEAAYWGNILEDIVAREFSSRTGLKVQRRNAILQHPTYQFMLANIDREIISRHGRGILEIKTTNEYNKKAWDDGDKLPDHVLVQVQHYLAVTGYSYAYVAVLIGGQNYRHFHIPRDEDVIQYLIKIESNFWQLVESRTPPPMDGSESSTELLSVLYPTADPGSEKILPPEAGDLIDAYDNALDEEKNASERKEEASNKLKALLGEFEVGIAGERKVTWKNVASNRLDTKLLKAEHPDLYSRYSRESSTRRFSVK